MITQPGDTDAEPATPTGSDGSELVISIERGGGFVPQGSDFRSPPLVAIYGDGTVITPAPTTAIFPGPAVAPLVVGTLAGTEVDRLAEGLVDAGLLDEPVADVGESLVADAATTTVRLVVDGQEQVVDLYALGLAGGLGESLPGVTPEQAQRRRRLATAVDEVTSAAVEVGQRAWVPDRYRILPLASGDGGGELVPGEQMWPLEGVKLVEGTCVAVSGPEAETLRPVLDQASEITRWTTATGDVFQLAVRAVLPHEDDCPA